MPPTVDVHEIDCSLRQILLSIPYRKHGSVAGQVDMNHRMSMLRVPPRIVQFRPCSAMLQTHLPFALANGQPPEMSGCNCGKE